MCVPKETNAFILKRRVLDPVLNSVAVLAVKLRMWTHEGKNVCMWYESRGLTPFLIEIQQVKYLNMEGH